MAARRSSSRRSQPAEEFDDRFVDRKCMDWFHSRKDASFVVERTVHDEVNEALSFRATLDKIGWGATMDVYPYYYPELVRIFYANVKDKQSSVQSFVTTVKGQPIMVDPSVINTVLGLPQGGKTVTFDVNNRVCNEYPDWSYTEGSLKLGAWIKGSRRADGREDIHNRYMFPMAKTLLRYFQSNIAPKASASNEVRLFDVFFIEQMLDDQPRDSHFALAPFIVHDMLETCRVKNDQKAFVFPCLISKLLERCNLVSPEDQVEHMPPKHVFTLYTVGRLDVKWRNDRWENTLRDHLNSEGPSRRSGPGKRRKPQAPPQEEPSQEQAPLEEDLLLSFEYGIPGQTSGSGTSRRDELRDWMTRMEGYAQESRQDVQQLRQRSERTDQNVQEIREEVREMRGRFNSLFDMVKACFKPDSRSADQ